MAELTNIAKFLKLNLSQKAISDVADQIYGKPGEGTFNVGKIGNWKLYFNELHKEHFKDVFGHELIELGYETDYNW